MLLYPFPMPNLTITTDYARSFGNPEPYLRLIGQAGFVGVHWCHHWLGEHRYRPREVQRIRGMLERHGLDMNDLHGAVGIFSDWSSPIELRRRTGVGQIKNRIQMTAELGGDAVVLHLPEGRLTAGDGWMNPARRSLYDLESTAREAGVRVALENLPTPGHMEAMLGLCAEYPSEFVGICYDSGHGNMAGNGLDLLDQLVDMGGQGNGSRLAALHLHDNLGNQDDHLPPLWGNIDWQRCMGILDAVGYRKPLCLECSIRHSGHKSDREFLQDAMTAGEKLIELREGEGEANGS
ncbi:MAG: sugar phosphate isomerase/epimerase family protein [Spirochaetia bacterium]